MGTTDASASRIRGSSGAEPFEPFTEGIELVRPEVAYRSRVTIAALPFEPDDSSATPRRSSR